MLRLLRYQKRAPSIAVTSASKAVCMGPSDLLSWARASPMLSRFKLGQGHLFVLFVLFVSIAFTVLSPRRGM
jgi:hypothetical protein